MPQFRRVAFQRAIGLPQRVQPLPVQAGRCGSNPLDGWQHGCLPDQMVRNPGEKFPQHVARGEIRERALIRTDGAGGGWQGAGQTFQASTVLAQIHRRPSGPIGAPTLLHQIGQHMLAVDQRAGELQGFAPVAQVIADHHARRPCRIVPNHREQMDGIGGGQSQGRNFPGRQGRRLAGSGRFGHQRRGRERHAALRGQPNRPLAGSRFS
ncbi:MAG: hypothetical protein WAV07_20075 [Candidatus Contendobacter sp.]